MNRPLVYYAISLFMGCFLSLVFMNNILMGAVLTASFLIIVFFTIDKNFFTLVMLFLLTGFLSFKLYYNINITEVPIIVRTIQIKEFYAIGDYQGKKIMLKGITKDLKEGRLAIIKGNFILEKDYERGIIGTYNIEKASVQKKDFIFSLYESKSKIYEKFNRILGPRKTALIMSLCFGESRYLSKDQKDEFLKLGVIHAISVSGFHMAIIYKVLECILGLYASIVICFLYALFTGLQSSTLRAFIMILIFKISKKVFKKYDALSSLSLSAMCLLIFKPYYVADLGFILSYLSTLGIILYYKPIKRSLYNLPEKINEALSLTFSAQLFSMPFVAMTLNNFSMGFILGNLILLPIYSVLVVLGNAGLIFSYFSEVFKIFTFALDYILTSLEGINYLLLKACPEIIYFTYMDGIAMLGILECYFLVRKGYKRFSYFPSIIFLFIMLESYYIFPQVEYINIGYNYSVIIRYKSKAVFLCNTSAQNNSEQLKQKYRVNKIVYDANQGLTVKLYKDLIVKIPQTYKKQGGLNLNLFIKGKRISFLKDSKSNNIDTLKEYDIIKVPSNMANGGKARSLGGKNSDVYKIIFGKVYE